MRLTPTAQRWARLIAELDQSDLTATAFAAKRGVNPSTLAWWRRKLRQGRAGTGFVAVSLPAPASVPAVPVLRLELVEGHVAMDVPVGVDLAWLRAVVVALS